MPLDPQAEAHLAGVAGLGLPAIEQVSPEAARAAAEAATPDLYGPAEPVTSVADTEVAGVPVRVYDPEPDAGLPLVVWMHGGGWVVGSRATCDGPCRAMANRTRARVLSVEYRRAPEHRFPAALDDCWAVARWALEQGRPVAVGGDSAGGNLAAVVALRARAAGLLPALQVLVYPVIDHDFGTPSYARNALGYGLTAAAMRWYWDHYLGSAPGHHPEASPLRAESLAGLAPALMVVCEYDPLRDEGVAYADRLRAEGNQVRLVEYPGMIHGFLRMAAVLDRTRDLVELCSDSMREALAASGR